LRVGAINQPELSIKLLPDFAERNSALYMVL
jgi:hypothetical protein